MTHIAFILTQRVESVEHLGNTVQRLFVRDTVEVEIAGGNLLIFLFKNQGVVIGLYDIHHPINMVDLSDGVEREIDLAEKCDMEIEYLEDTE